MKVSEFIERVKRYAKQHRLHCKYDARRGKGSHGRLELGDRVTTVKDLKKEIGPGLLLDMLNQLGLSKDDLGE